MYLLRLGMVLGLVKSSLMFLRCWHAWQRASKFQSSFMDSYFRPSISIKWTGTMWSTVSCRRLEHPSHTRGPFFNASCISRNLVPCFAFIRYFINLLISSILPITKNGQSSSGSPALHKHCGTDGTTSCGDLTLRACSRKHSREQKNRRQ